MPELFARQTEVSPLKKWPTRLVRGFVVVAFALLFLLSIGVVAATAMRVVNPELFEKLIGSMFASKQNTDTPVVQTQGSTNIVDESTASSLLQFDVPATFTAMLTAARLTVTGDTNLEGPVSAGSTLEVDDVSTFNDDVTIKGNLRINRDLIGNNVDIDVDNGTVIASNLVYSIIAGNGISLSGDQDITVTNSDRGSDQRIFKTIKVGDSTFEASSNTDTLTFAAGDNVTMSMDATNKKLTISSTGGGTAAGHNPVTLAGSYDYLTLSSQQITLGQIDLTTDVTGVLPLANGGTGANSLTNLITLATHTTGNYVATVADSGSSIISVSGSGSENAAVTLGVVADSLDFSEFKDALALDASTTITQDGSEALTFSNTGTGNLIIDLTSTGDFLIKDNNTTFATFSDTGTVAFTGTLQANDYYSGDGTQGATTTFSGLTFKDGLYTSGSISGFDNYQYWTLTDGSTPTNLTSLSTLTLSDDNLINAVTGAGTLVFSIAADGLDFSELKEALALDASTDIAVDNAEVFSITNTGSANSLLVNDAVGDASPFVITADGNVGIGTTTVSAKLHSLSTTEQLRLGYDASNYSSFTVSSSGDITLDATGGDFSLASGDNFNLTAAANLIFGTTTLAETTASTDSGAYLIGVFDEFDNSASANVQDVLDDLDAAITAAGGSSNIFGTIAGTTGTNPVADSSTDTLTLASTDFTITGNSSTDTLTFAVVDDILNFTEFADTLALDAALILNQGSNAWTQNFTGTSTSGLTYNADSLTTGTGLHVSSTGTITSGGELVNITANSLTTGDLLALSGTGITTGRGIHLNLASTDATAGNLKGQNIVLADTGNVTADTDNTYGQYIDLTRTGASGTNTINAYGQYITATGDTATDSLYGVYASVQGANQNFAAVFNTTHNGTGTVTNHNGIYTDINNGNIGTITNAFGMNFTLNNDSTGIITNARGISATIQNSGDGTITEARSVHVGFSNPEVLGTIITGYGIYVQSPINGGTFTNNYGLFIQDQFMAGATNAYNVYSEGASSRNYFQGSIGIGTTTISAKTHVLSTTEQLRLGYDASNYAAFTTDSSGNLSINASGTKTTIADDLQVTGNDILDSGATSRVTLGATTTLTNSTLVLSGTSTLTASSLTALNCSNCIDFDDFANSPTLDANFALTQSSNTWTQTYTGTTTSAFTYNANSLTTASGVAVNANGLTTGKGIDLQSTSTALTSGSLANFYWNPGSTTTATGDLFKLDIGVNAVLTGNLLALYNNGSSIFRVGTAQINSDVPHSFNAAGDVSVAYDLAFTNQTSANITSLGPLSIAAGEAFENNDLNLGAYGTGKINLVNSGLGLQTSEKIILDTDDTGDSYFAHSNSGNYVSAFADGVEAARFKVDGSVDGNTTFNANAFDLAEYYPTKDTTVEAGDVVSIAPKSESDSAATDSPYLVEKTSEISAGQVLGIVSTKAGFALGGGSFRSEMCSAVMQDGGEETVRQTLIEKELRAELGELAQAKQVSATVQAAVATGSAQVTALSLSAQATTSSVSTQTAAAPTASQSAVLSHSIHELSDATLAAIEDKIQTCKAISSVPIALAGRVPVKVDLTRASEIKAGDLLMASTTTPGKAMKANQAGWVIGRALEDYTTGNDTVMTFVFVTYYNGGSTTPLVNVQPTNTTSISLSDDIGDILGVSTDSSDSPYLISYASLNVVGDLVATSLTATSQIIAGNLTIDSTENSITSIADSILKLQTDSFAGNVDIFNGKIIFNTDGDIITLSDIQARMIGAESFAVRTGKDANGHDTSSVGIGTVKAGSKESVISNNNVTAASKIFVTPRTSTKGQTLFVSAVEQGAFTVNIDTTLSNDLLFDYWILGVE